MEKIKYIPPQIEIVLLDNEISLVLESSPPSGPYEGLYLDPKFKTDCFNLT